jgi:hypothetical protein
MKSLFILIIGVAIGIFVNSDFSESEEPDEYTKFLIEQERGEEEEEKLEREEQLYQDYENYLFDMERINWEGHCRDILFSLGPPPPEYTNLGGCHAYSLVWEEARNTKITNPIVKIPTFEEYKKQ